MPGCFASTSLTPSSRRCRFDRADARDDRDRALAAEQLHGLLAHDPAGREVVDAVEGHPLRFRRVGVPGDDRNAGVDRAVDGVGEEVAVQRRDRDAVDALRDERLEDLLLLQLVGALRRAPEDLDVAELGRLALRADLRVVEDRDVERLGNDREAQLLRRRASGRRSPVLLAPATRGKDATQSHHKTESLHETPRASRHHSLLFSSI